MAAACLSAAGCRDRAPANAEVQEPASVTIQTARLETLRATVTGRGTVTPAAAADWTIYPPETGRVVALPKAEGETVEPGDVLVRFDFANATEDVNARQSGVLAAITRVDSAKTELTKVSGLFDRGYAPRNNYEAAKNAVARAEMDLARAKQQLDAATAAAERAVIKARFPGVVARRFHNEGDLVNGSINDPVLRVVDPTRLQVAMTVSIQQLAQVVPGQQATIVSSNGSEPGSVVLRPMTTDPHATSQEIRLAFTNPSTAAVDSPVHVEILLDERPNVVALPTAAIVKAEDGSMFVMIAGADGRAHRRDVRVGLTVGDRSEIVSGVTPGDHVIIKSPDPVADGALIAIER